MKKLLKDFRLVCRGIGVLHRLSPWNLLAKCVRSVCNAAIPFANFYLSAMIIDGLAAKEPVGRLAMLVGITVAVNLALVLLSRLMDLVNWRKWNSFYLGYRLSLGEKVQALPYEKIESPETHRMLKNIDDAMSIGNYGLIKLHSRIPLFVENFLKVCFSVGFILSAILQKSGAVKTPLQAFANSWAGDGVFVLLIGLGALACITANKKIANCSYGHLSRLSKNNRVFDYYLNHYLDSHRAGKDIRLYRQDRVITDEIDSVGNKNSRIVGDMNRSIYRAMCRIGAANFLLVLYTYMYVGLKALSGIFAVGSIVKYSGGVLQFATAFSDMMDAFSQLRANSKYLSDYFAFADLPEESKNKSNAVPEEGISKIEVRHVSFKYPGTDSWVLRDISFEIVPGEKIAIVGKNGSGKTTMIKLLCRLYEPTEGEILLNGRDIREYDIDEYRRLLGVVFQDFKLFSFTLGQNVSGRMSYDRARAGDCLVRSGFGSRLSKMPDGLDTYLYRDFDAEGVEISGGEAQKIALARALYKETPLIVLDEPTAALDPIAEAEIYAKFHEIVGDKTAIFISHRLSSCQFCNRILVFSDKKLVQQGSHSQLCCVDGCYAELWNAQAQYYA